ncbi:Glutamate permease [Rodentibacter pneumotropicus]|uniref:Glutamate permease n=1 Tax=Rodentibacter pneumotropicus TaxID=758 RepID=A0A448MRI7_9PAST|nr:Glutamate permease [Rodentibacter pneumotropicus]
MMLVFFSSIGLSANFARLIKGGKPLIIFLFIAATLIFFQNVIGIVGAQILGIDPAYGLLAGSVTLTGGHGTGVAWAETFIKKFNLPAATEIAMACATFGLVFGGIIGGPVARFLLNRQNKEKIRKMMMLMMSKKPLNIQPINVKSMHVRSLKPLQ